MAPAVRLAIRLGERLGMLGPAMKQQLDDTQQADAALRDTLVRFVHLGLLLLALATITTFLMLKVVPVYERMFYEFDAELPASTRLLIRLSNLVVNYWFLVPLAISIPLALGGIFLIVMYLWENLHTDYSDRPVERWLVRPRRIVRVVLALLASICLAPFCVGPLFAVLFMLPAFFVVLYFIGFFPRDLPVVWKLFRRYDGALVMRGLAVAVRRGLPLVPALKAVREAYPVRHIAALLERVTQRIAGGAGWIDALRQAKLISRADAAVLAAAERAGNLPWALEEMADSVIRRQTYRLQIATNLIFPPALLAVAALVGLFAVGLFSPLVTLIQSLT
jgi:type II secretory pathway component PulF